MLTVPRLAYAVPRRLAEALELLERGNRGRAAGEGDAAARRGPVVPVAGGTDLVPNLKHRLVTPELLVDLTRLEEEHLRGVRVSAEGIAIGALTPLAEAAASPALARAYPALARGLGLVASPQIRNAGTVGGNLCLDTRCIYYNQTAFWRQALGYCLKREGTRCHVVPGGTRCVAACSSDGATLLTALGARVRLERPGGERWLPVEQLFVGEGRRHLVLEPWELVTEVRLPPPDPGLATAYEKLRPRGSIDFPVLAVAVALVRDPDGLCRRLAVAVSGLGAKPRVVAGLDALVAGRPFDDERAAAVAEAAYRQCHPLTNLAVDPDWRHEMVRVFVRRALARAAGARGSEMVS